MDNRVQATLEKQLKARRKRQRRRRIVIALGLAVVIGVILALVIPVFTMETDPICGLEEHTHTEECYENVSTLTCDMEEDAGHAHSEECYTETSALICELEEGEDHTHGEECYETQRELTCEEEEREGHTHGEECYTEEQVNICGKTEHVHTDECYPDKGEKKEESKSDPSADVETASQWEKSVAGVNLSGNWAKDLLAIAKSQLGYEESTRNFIETEDGKRQGYSRYGEWYGNSYGDWCAMFVSFCLKYADIPGTVMPYEASCDAWIRTLTEKELFTNDKDFIPEPGDIVFFDWNLDGSSDHVGIVLAVEGSGSDATLRTIEGNSDDRVQMVKYDLGESCICGYAKLPEDPENKFGKTYLYMDDAVEVAVTLPKDSEVPANAVLSVKPIERTDSGYTDYVTGAKNAADAPTAEVLLYDISFYTPGDAYIPVSDSAIVSIRFKDRKTGGDVSIIHFEDDKEEPTVLDSVDVVSDDENGVAQVTFETEGFSVYAITMESSGEVHWMTDDEITDITLSRFHDYRWEVLDTNHTVILTEEDLLRFGISYTLPVGTVSAQNNVVKYNLPTDLVIIENQGGDVKDSNFNTVGQYLVDQDGTITIVYDKAFAEKNKELPINGNVFFHAEVKYVETTEYEEKIIEIGGATITIRPPEQITTTNDLKVEKYSNVVDRENGIIEYTIKVSSEHGTSQTVHLSDGMNSGKIITDVNVTKGGQAVEVANSNKWTNGFSFDLPQMYPGDEYIITYTAKLDSTVNGDIDVDNNVRVESRDEHNRSITDTAHTSDRFHRDVLTKQGELREDKIYWTIVVNRQKMDISGWTLKDELNGQNYTGTVQLTAESTGQTIDVQLPYTFPEGSHDTYTVTYVTEESVELGNNSTYNKAILEQNPGNGGDHGHIDTDINVEGESYEPLEKEALGVNRIDGDTVTLNWRATIDVDKGGIAAPWTFEDYLGDDYQWYTADQLRAMAASLESSLNAADLGHLEYDIIAFPNAWYNDPSQAYSIKGLDDSLRYKKYVVTFNTPLNQGSVFSFEYSSTGDVTDIVNEKWFNNDCDLNNRVYKKATNKFVNDRPTVEKSDRKGGGKESEHPLDQVSNGLEWDIKVNLPADYDGSEITLYEHVPEGLEPAEMKLTMKNALWMEAKADIDVNNEGDYTATLWNWNEQVNEYYQFRMEKTSTGYKVILPEETLRGHNFKEISLYFRATIKDDAQWTENGHSHYATFKNTVEIRDHQDRVIGEDEQTQIIIDGEDTPDTQLLIKRITNKQNDEEHSWGANYDENIIEYEVAVNPEGIELLAEGEKLTLVDELRYQHNPWWGKMRAYLLPNSVKVYMMNPDGSAGSELDRSQWSYTWREEYEEAGGNKNYIDTMEFKLPDGMPLLVTYKYIIDGELDRGGELTNSVKLSGFTGENAEHKTVTSVKIVEGSARADIDGIVFYKVDQDDNRKTLSGAEFNLYKWSREANNWNGEYVPVKDPATDEPMLFVSDDKGVIVFGSLDRNTAYMLVETKAPSGYNLREDPFYFKVTDDVGKYPVIQPDNFNGREFSNGGYIYFNNKKNDIPTVELPATGGEGVGMYYILGGLLISAAFIITAAKRKKA